MPDTIAVKGLRELSRAFTRAGKATSKELRLELREVVEPVRSAAERLAVQRIRNIGPHWSAMRVGVTQRAIYVAPKERGVKSRTDRSRRRPNLKPLLLDRAMDPALAENVPEIEAGFDHMLDKITNSWEAI